jgi:hypothetical protein
LIQPLLDLNPQNLNISYLPWKDIPDAADYGQPGANCGLTNLTSIPYSANLNKVDVEGLIAITNFMNNSLATTPALQTTFAAFLQYGNVGFHLHTEDSSAFPFRDTILYV